MVGPLGYVEVHVRARHDHDVRVCHALQGVVEVQEGCGEGGLRNGRREGGLGVDWRGRVRGAYFFTRLN